jgi:predicted GNAT family acetyltransferase
MEAKGKTTSLFYDNPAAGSIYLKMGYTDMGK